MALSKKAQTLYAQVTKDGAPRSELKKIAKEIKKDHELAMELWSTAELMPRMLAALIMNKTLLTQEVIEQLAADLETHSEKERNHISEWLLANQLMKSAKTTALLLTWQDHKSPVLRRLFWYYQARLRWTGKTDHDNTLDLLTTIEEKMETEVPEVQWTMNFCAAQIGIYVPELRKRCIALGERVGLYKEEKAVKGCTPSYLPEFIRIEVEKRA